MEEARAVGAELTEVRALNTLGFTRAGLGDEAEGIATLREALRRCRPSASPGRPRAARPSTSRSCSTSPGRTEEALAVVARGARRGARAARSGRASTRSCVVQEVNLLIRLGRLAEARERLPRACRARRLLHAAFLARHARPARAADRRPRRLREELEPAEPAERRRPRAAVDRAAHATSRSSSRCARTGSTTRAPRRARAPSGSRTPTRRRGCSGSPGWPSASRPRPPGARRRSASTTRPCSTTRSPRCAGRAAGAPALRRGVRAGAGWRKAELARRRTLLGDAPADPGPWEEVARAFDALALPAARRLRPLPRRRGARHGRRPRRRRGPAARRSRAAAAIGITLLAADVAALARRARIDLGAGGRRRAEPAPATTRRPPASASRRASSRCCCSSPRAARTARSARRCS